MAIQNGTAILLEVASSTIAGSTDQSFSAEADMIEITTKDSNGHKEFMSGEDSATLTISALYDPSASAGTGFSDAFSLLKAGTVSAFKWGQFATTGDKYLSGNLIIQKVDINGPKNEASSYSLTCQVTGDFTEETVA